MNVVLVTLAVLLLCNQSDAVQCYECMRNTTEGLGIGDRIRCGICKGCVGCGGAITVALGFPSEFVSFFKHNFCIKPYVAREPHMDSIKWENGI